MLLKQLVLAATAAAFLVVPEMPQAEDEAYKALPIDVAETTEIPPTAMQQTVDVPCKKCKGKDTHLSMDFAVEDGSRLTLNGYELYPSADPWHGDLTATAVKANGKKKEQLLGYSLAVGPQAIDEEQRLEIVSVGLHIIEVGGRFIEGIPTVNIKLIKAPSGEILIGDVAVQDQSASESNCDDMWCLIKESWNSTWKDLKTFKPCHKAGKPGHHGHGHKDKIQLDGKRPHGDPSQPDHEYNWGRLLKNIAVSILLPVLTGITAGIAVAVFAMGICSFVAILFRSRRRRARRSSRRSKHAAVTEPAAEEEKAGLMDQEQEFTEPPPQYQDNEASNQS